MSSSTSANYGQFYLTDCVCTVKQNITSECQPSVLKLQTKRKVYKSQILLFFYAKSAQDRKIDTWVWFPCVYGFASSLYSRKLQLVDCISICLVCKKSRNSLPINCIICIPISNEWDFFILTYFYLHLVFPHLLFGCQISMLQYSSVLLICTLLMKNIFSCLFCHPYVFFHEVSVKVIGPFFNQVFLIVEL